MKKMQRLFIAVIIIFICPILLFQANDDDYYITRIDEIAEAGTYNVLLHDASGEHTKVIRVTVLFPRTIENKTLAEVIDARDIRIEKKTFQTLSDEDLILLTSARAWNQKTNEEIPIKVTSKEIVDKKNGLFTVTFSTALKTMTTINVTEVSAEAVLNKNNQTYDNINSLQISSRYIFIYTLLIFIPIILMILLYIISKNRKRKYRELLYDEVNNNKKR